MEQHSIFRLLRENPAFPAGKVAAQSCSVKRLHGYNSFHSDNAVSRKRRKQGEVNGGAHVEESSSVSGSSSSSSSLHVEAREREQFGADIADTMRNTSHSKNITSNDQELKGSLISAPSSSDLEGASGMEKFVTINSSSGEIVGLIDKNIEMQRSGGTVESNSSWSNIMKKGVEIPITGNRVDSSCSKFLQNEGLEEHELLPPLCSFGFTSMFVPSQKPLIRFNFTSLTKAVGYSA